VNVDWRSVPYGVEAVPIDYGSVRLDYELVRVQIDCTADSKAQTLVSKAPDGFKGV
jgi:hypothetical protein